MDLTKAFTFVFDDPDWLKKVAINAIIGIIPIVGQLYLLGWGLEVARRVTTGSTTPLPDVDFGTYLTFGFQALVVSLVYSAPLWVITVIVGVLGTLVGEPGANTAEALSVLLGICGGGFVLVFGLLLALFLPAAYARIAVFGSIGAGLDIGAVWELVRAAVGAWVLVWVGTLVAGLLAAVVGSLACGIGLVFTMAYYQVVMGHLYGQAYLTSGGRV